MSDDSGASLVLDIQFDDGSVQKGFVRLADFSGKTAKKVQGDFDGVKLIDFDELESSGVRAFTGLSGSFLKFGLVAAGVGLVIEGIKKSFDFALQGERIGAISAQFENLTKQAGIVGDSLKDSLIKSADGMIDADDLLQAANRSIINLGSSAKRLPEILDIARKATVALGGNFQERFESIVQAIETGNQKALKNAGIIIDVEEAYKKFAKTLGLTTSELTQAQRQQAVLNAVISEGGSKLKNVDGSVQPVSDDLDRLKTAFKELGDGIATTVSQWGIWQAIIKADTSFIKGVSDFFFPVDDLSKSIEATKSKINELQAALRDVKPDSDQNVTDQMVKELIYFNAQLDKQVASYEKLKAAKQDAANVTSGPQKAENKLSPAQNAAIKLRSLMVLDAENQQALAQNAIEEGKTQFILSEYDKRNALFAIYSQKNVLLEEDFRLKSQELDEQRKAGQIQTENEFQAKLLQLRTDYANKQAQNDLARIRTQSESFEQFNESASGSAAIAGGFSEMLHGAKISASDFAHNAAANFREVGKQMFTSLGQAGGQAFAAFGKAVATGQDSLGAFVDSLLASMGQMAVQLGTQFILQGAAYTWAGMPNGPALMAAGAALAAFGGILSAAGAGGQSGSGGVSSTGGGIASSDSTTTEVVQPKDLERKKPDTYINLAIHGDVLDSDEAGLRLVNIINSSFDKNGVQIQRGAVA